MTEWPGRSTARNLRWLASDLVRVARGALVSAAALSHSSARVSPNQLDAIQRCVDWLKDYIGSPHPELGRNGDVCPFVNTALRKQRMSFVVLDQIATPDLREISSRVLYEAWRLRRRLRESDKLSELTTTNVLLPNLTGEAAHVVHAVHDSCKTTLMRRGIMLAVFYPGYDKPAIYNKDFRLYRSPFPVIVVRPMALHDIVFLDNNRAAFREYRRRFGARYAAGKVSDEFGYPERFRSAERRFGLA
jgi:hypothetical protein